MVVMAAQTEASSTYAKGQIDDDDNPVEVDKVNTLAEVSALNAAYESCNVHGSCYC